MHINPFWKVFYFKSSWSKFIPFRVDSFIFASPEGIRSPQSSQVSYESAHDKSYNKICVTSKDSGQPVHPISMARAHVYSSLDSPEAVEDTGDQRSLIRLFGCAGWSESSLVARLIVGFVVRWLIYLIIFIYLFIYNKALKCWAFALLEIVSLGWLDLQQQFINETTRKTKKSESVYWIGFQLLRVNWPLWRWLANQLAAFSWRGMPQYSHTQTKIKRKINKRKYYIRRIISFWDKNTRHWKKIT